MNNANDHSKRNWLSLLFLTLYYGIIFTTMVYGIRATSDASIFFAIVSALAGVAGGMYGREHFVRLKEMIRKIILENSVRMVFVILTSKLRGRFERVPTTRLMLLHD